MVFALSGQTELREREVSLISAAFWPEAFDMQTLLCIWLTRERERREWSEEKRIGKNGEKKREICNKSV